MSKMPEYSSAEKYIMIVFNTDLDNTMIYSYKHDIGDDKLCAEIYQGREISFVTKKTSELLKAVNSAVMLVPTTTRTFEQYRRIDLGFGVPKYALVCNGGVLLEDGKEDEEWYRESLRLTVDCREQLLFAAEILEKDASRTLDVRNIRDLFVFTKCDEPLRSVEVLQNKLDSSLVDVFNNGVKVYVVPKKLSKGVAVSRFKKKVGADFVIAAGDSEFDISMLCAADLAIAPRELADRTALPETSFICSDEEIFSEKVLERVLEIAKNDFSTSYGA